jgi:hypothetical protein
MRGDGGITFGKHDVFVELGSELQPFWGFLPGIVIDCSG